MFTAHRTANDPEIWKTLQSPFPAEAHLMVKDPEPYVAAWIAAGAKRCIVHVESVTPESVARLVLMCKEKNVELMLAMNPNTPAEAVHPYLSFFNEFQVLAVQPGAAGQGLLPGMPEKVSALRAMAPDATIEVDGGVDITTAPILASAGADTLVSGSHIFGSVDPKKAYEALKAI
jgi:ribulose-phosphate 3-epimerase